ncbi:hypothetical protein [Streptomyces sp. DSM 40750]|nr:hypothetical protein [Streptomyces sp. DSM 40750]UUU21183.1 hypothetical protein JIX55_13180 [Streptomyces sp. DSM 40750]
MRERAPADMLGRVSSAFLPVAALIPALKPDVSVVEPDDDTTTVRVPL